MVASGETALVPELAVSDWRASRRFYCGILGFHCHYERPEEGFCHLGLGEAALMIDQIGLGRTFGDGLAPAARPFGKGVNLQIRVPRIQPLVTALSATGTPLHLPPEDRWYRRRDDEVGHRQFVVADPDGYLLRFVETLGARPLKAQPRPTQDRHSP